MCCCILITITGCKKIDKMTNFNMEYNETVVIPASTGINLPFNILTPNVETNSESTFAVNNTRKDLVNEIRLTKLDLRITSPSNGTFSFVRSLSIFLSADGLSETKIAWIENVPSNVGNVLYLDVSGADLKEYIKKDKFTLRLNSVTDELITSDYQINVHAVYQVDAKLISK